MILVKNPLEVYKNELNDQNSYIFILHMYHILTDERRVVPEYKKFKESD